MTDAKDLDAAGAGDATHHAPRADREAVEARTKTKAQGPTTLNDRACVQLRDDRAELERALAALKRQASKAGVSSPLDVLARGHMLVRVAAFS